MGPSVKESSPCSTTFVVFASRCLFFLKGIFFYYFKLFFDVFLNYFDVLISKII